MYRYWVTSKSRQDASVLVSGHFLDIQDEKVENESSVAEDQELESLAVSRQLHQTLCGT